MIDAVLSYHMNPATCGVAKFNHALAKRLGVPVFLYSMCDARHPLVSIKPSEMTPRPNRPRWIDYDLLLHDRTLSPESELIQCASRVFYADEVGCPSTVEGNPDRGGYRVLTFGMAHKLVLPHFRKLKEDLERDHPDYTISLSTAVHEGSPWVEALTQSAEAMREIFGPRLRILGFLADDALAREIQECDAVAAFFQPALRANNTSAWAALSAGKFLYTNLDDKSPALDPQQYGWDALLKVLA